MKLRVGLVGLGDAWETRYRSALLAMSDRFEVRAVCSEVALMADRVAQQFGADAVDGFRSLIAREDIDAILMLSPQWYGSLPILAACDAGKAVYCAASLDLELEEAGKVKQRVEQSGIAFMAEFPRRHMAATARLKELIATTLGDPQLLFCHLRQPIPDASNTRQRQSVHTRMTRDLIELIDWCRYVVGRDPVSVLGVCYEPDDFARSGRYHSLSLDFNETDSARGPLAQISCGHYLPASWAEATTFRPPAALQVRCQHGVAFVDLPASLVWFDEAGRHMESLDAERPVDEKLLALFHRAVTSLVRRIEDLDDTYRALCVVRASEQSSREGRRIPLSY